MTQPDPAPAGATIRQERTLDMLVVGGGPGGLTAAARAVELGLSAMVIDYDDLMKRIRDYSKDKLILPGFGGGDRMRFPKGGKLVSALRFAAIDKDELCRQWKTLLKSKVPSQVGVELTGLERAADGALRALCWNHQTRTEQVVRAKNVVLAIGHGVPRRFDIPGDTDGIAFRLDDPARYVGRPVCVIGGGTSAAEAVIAISNAKAQDGDPCAVYWSYRGDRLPRVSKALAEVFFEAYAGNGNIRYFPKSEPAAVTVADDHREYLSIRVDRRCIEGRPPETMHLEFPKPDCIACIGQDVPEKLLTVLGAPMVRGGPRNKKRMAVNRYMETAVPNLYLVGDLLSQAYFRTDDFDADPAGFEEVKHRGNIKSAMRDGVLVAQIIHQRLKGQTEIDLSLGDEDDLPEPARKTAALQRAAPRTGGPTDAASADGPRLFRILPNGVVEGEHALRQNGEVTIGSADADILFPEDPGLTSRHAAVIHDQGGWRLEASPEAADVFIGARPAVKIPLKSGDLIRAGRQFLLILDDAGRFRVEHYDPRGELKASRELSEKPLVAGREAPDLTLDPDDVTLSRRHLALSVEGGRCCVKDLKSANGTYLRVRKAARLKHGDRMIIGRQLLVFSERDDAVLDTGRMEAVAPDAKPAAAAPPPAAVDPGGPSVTFQNLGKTCAAVAGQTICEVAEANGIALNAECHAGVCGSDPVRILSGREHLDSEPRDQESETLEDICELKPGECRLACMARIKGPITVEIVKG